ncbi:MAG: hypothetical protein BGN89_07855 [Alphaproteobacteria bacterium 64-6]|nr:MAG: hypothetical protein BGN89_07855 [Alphaproteobacteria bacterium 64-6]
MRAKPHALLSIALLAGAILSASPSSALETYKIVGVPAGDRLVMREEPQEGGKPTEWAALGNIPGNATSVLGTGRSKEVGKQRWSEVAFNGVTGWVNARFLATADDPMDLKGETFQCAGTEPFWGVTLAPKEGEFSEPDSNSKLTIARVQPATARLFPLLYRLRNEKGQSLRATVSHQQWCTDGMSDYDYAFQVLLSDDENFYEGCCFLKR